MLIRRGRGAGGRARIASLKCGGVCGRMRGFVSEASEWHTTSLPLLVAQSTRPAGSRCPETRGSPNLNNKPPHAQAQHLRERGDGGGGWLAAQAEEGSGEETRRVKKRDVFFFSVFNPIRPNEAGFCPKGPQSVKRDVVGVEIARSRWTRTNHTPPLSSHIREQTSNHAAPPHCDCSGPPRRQRGGPHNGNPH